MQTPNFKSDGTIQPCRFVSVSLTKDFYVAETVSSALAAQMIGISGESSKDGRSDASNTAHSEVDDPVDILGVAQTALLEMAATCTVGQYLKPNISTDGKGIPAVLSGGGAQYVGAIALQACTHSSQKIRVQVVIFWITT